MPREIDARPASLLVAGLLGPDVQRAAGLPESRDMLENECGLLDGGHQMFRCPWMNDVVRNDLDIRESLMGGRLHQPVFPHADLAACVARPAPECRHQALDEDLRIPVVGLEEEQPPPWLEEPVDLPQVLRISVVAEDRRPDDVVEALSRQVALEVRDDGRRSHSGIRFASACCARSALNTAAVIGFSLRSTDVRCAVQRPLPAPISRSDSPGSTWKQCRTVTARQFSLMRRGRRVAKPVGLPRSLHLPEVLHQRHVRPLSRRFWISAAAAALILGQDRRLPAASRLTSRAGTRARRLTPSRPRSKRRS